MGNKDLVVGLLKEAIPVFQLPVLSQLVDLLAGMIVARREAKKMVEALRAESVRLARRIVSVNGAVVAGDLPVGTRFAKPFKLHGVPGAPEAPLVLRLELPPEPWRFVAHPCDPRVKKGIVRTYPGGRCRDQRAWEEAA